MELQNGISIYCRELGHGCRVFCGAHAAAPQLLTLCANIAVERELRLLDFGNRCDMYFAARRLRELTLDPSAAMSNIRLQRAFTCYQAAALLDELDITAGTPLIILDLLMPFMDESVKPKERERLFGTVRARLEELKTAHAVFIGVKPPAKMFAAVGIPLLNALVREFGVIELKEAALPDTREAAQPTLF